MEVPSLSALESLPRELIWMLIDHAPETVRHLRNASKTVKYHVESYITEHLKESFVRKVKVSGGISDTNGMAEIIITIDVPSRKADTFLLRFILEQFPCHLIKCKSTEKFDNFARREFEFKASVHAHSTLELLRNCIGSQLEKMTLELGQHEIDISAVYMLIGGIGFRDFVFTGKVLTTDALFHIHEIIKSHNVEQLKMSVGKCTAPDIAEVLLELSSIVRSLCIDQQIVDGVFDDCYYLLGKHRLDWAPIIIDMFSRKLHKLRINNDVYKFYLWRTSVNALKYRLPNLNKNLWFSTTCNSTIPEINIFTNEHSVILHRINGGSNFSVKHTSKVMDQFGI